MSSEPKRPAFVPIPESLPTAFPLFCALSPSTACSLILGILFLELLGYDTIHRFNILQDFNRKRIEYLERF